MRLRTRLPLLTYLLIQGGAHYTSAHCHTVAGPSARVSRVRPPVRPYTEFLCWVRPPRGPYPELLLSGSAPREALP